MQFFASLIVVLSFIYYAYGFKTELSNDNIKWTVRDENNKYNVSATVPGGIYTDLMTAGVIPDIYYRFNDVESRWVAKTKWIYSRIFTVVHETLWNKTFVDLVFEGLDTFATIYLNDEKVGVSESMFIRYRFDIKQQLQKGENNLTVVFESPINEAQNRFDKQKENYVVPPKCVPSNYNGECHVNHIRKMQASFAWDWGPAFPSVGIWKPVYIVSYQTARVQDVSVRTIENENEWNVKLKVYLESTGTNVQVFGTIKTQLQVEDSKSIEIKTDVEGTTDQNGEFVQEVELSVPKDSVHQWFPNGFGSQPLYKLKITYDSYQKDKSIKELKIGFRNLELVQNKIDSGLTFYVKVNGVPVFAKGSNWIPGNVLPEIGTNETYIRYLLESSKEANMNMFRVWGGGVYESDKFYEIADELGILIWQDFMFACSMYPTDEIFTNLVRKEVKQNVRRLQHHPSVAIWAGNNENELALVSSWYGTSSNYTLYKNDYLKLYVDVVRKTCLENDDSRSFVTSSPSNGLEGEDEGFISSSPTDPRYGDVHFYDYGANGWYQFDYPIPRFSSEYGFQSMPTLSTLKSSTDVEDDLKLDSEFLNSRQHLSGGYSYMINSIERQLDLPDEGSDNYLKALTYYSQISQAMSIKAETEWYRQWRDRVDKSGEGLTMGALYWQLNDVWPAPTWSSIDFRGKWKMLHYFAKDFFAPILISPHMDEQGKVSIYLINDLPSKILSVKGMAWVFRWDSFEKDGVGIGGIDLDPLSTNFMVDLTLDDYLKQFNCGNVSEAKKNCFLYFTLSHSDNYEAIGPDNYLFPEPLKTVNGLKTPELNVTVDEMRNENGKTVFNLTVTSDRIAPFVWLEVDGIDGIFSTNGYLQVTPTKQITFKTDVKSIDRAILQSKLKVSSVLSAEYL